ncbi:hypothetical protein OUZ56_032375 [Daphnia magna]|uniref:Uncharacterized protein n=1 Tax=Daphnia magna TaxID=35525 RepID=A0ABR0B8Q8_9CRUS|nr:hypothetical protein OUZ56_032375 [Daphnia magna]
MALRLTGDEDFVVGKNRLEEPGNLGLRAVCERGHFRRKSRIVFGQRIFPFPQEKNLVFSCQRMKERRLREGRDDRARRAPQRRVVGPDRENFSVFPEFLQIARDRHFVAHRPVDGEILNHRKRRCRTPIRIPPKVRGEHVPGAVAVGGEGEGRERTACVVDEAGKARRVGVGAGNKQTPTRVRETELRVDHEQRPANAIFHARPPRRLLGRGGNFRRPFQVDFGRVARSEIARSRHRRPRAARCARLRSGTSAPGRAGSSAKGQECLHRAGPGGVPAS